MDKFYQNRGFNALLDVLILRYLDEGVVAVNNFVRLFLTDVLLDDHNAVILSFEDVQYDLLLSHQCFVDFEKAGILDSNLGETQK